MQKEHGYETIWVVTFIGIILALIVGALTGYYYSQKNVTKTTPTTPTPTVSTSSTPSLSTSTLPSSSSSTASWKTYTNSVDQYSIKYPDNWIVAEEEGSTRIQNKQGNIYASVGDTPNSEQVKGSYVVITAVYKDKSQTLLDYLKNTQFKGENVELASSKIGDRDGLKLTKLNSNWPSISSSWVANGEEVIYLGLNVSEESEKTTSTNIYNQMLETFQFSK